jgi:hypothetical protein
VSEAESPALDTDPGPIETDDPAEVEAETPDEKLPSRVWPDVAGSAYHDLIDGQLAREDSRKVSLESRGITMITSASTIVTLLFGLAALATQSSKFTLTGGSKAALAVAVGFLLLSAVLGVLTNAPLSYSEADPQALVRLLEERFWWGDPAIGRMRTAELEINQVSRARRMNSLKAKLLVAGLAAEILGVFAVAVAVLEILD